MHFLYWLYHSFIEFDDIGRAFVAEKNSEIVGLVAGTTNQGQRRQSRGGQQAVAFLVRAFNLRTPIYTQHHLIKLSVLELEIGLDSELTLQCSVTVFAKLN